jgi:hypothetical protein
VFLVDTTTQKKIFFLYHHRNYSNDQQPTNANRQLVARAGLLFSYWARQNNLVVAESTPALSGAHH